MLSIGRSATPDSGEFVSAVRRACAPCRRRIPAGSPLDLRRALGAPSDRAPGARDGPPPAQGARPGPLSWWVSRSWSSPFRGGAAGGVVGAVAVATAARVAAGSGAPVRCGVSRGGGSGWRRGRGGGPAGRSGAVPHGVKVQTSSDGSGRGGAEAVARARRLTGWRFKRAARAAAGTGWSVGCGAPRSGGQDGRRRWAGAPAGRSGAAPRGAEVKTGGDGSGRGGVQASPGRGASRGGFAVPALPGRRGRPPLKLPHLPDLGECVG